MKFFDVLVVRWDYSKHSDRSVFADFEDFVVLVLGLVILKMK